MTSGRKIDVLFAIPVLDRGGPDRVVYELIRALDRDRFRPRVMVSEPEGYYLSRLPADVEVEVLGSSRKLSDRYPLLRALRFIRRTAPDVVLGTQRMIVTLGVIAPAFRRRTRLVLRQANDVSADFEALVAASPVKHRVSRWITLSNLRRADAVVCQSAAMQSDLRALLGPVARLHVIGNPIDVEAIVRLADSSAPVRRGRPALVSVGRLAPQKGFDVLLEAVAQLRARYPELHLTIVGDGPQRGELETLAAQLGLAELVTFAGYSDRPLAYVRAADLFVLASRYEGFPNAALEALACGTPIVLTDCPGASSEIVRDGKNGRLARSVEAGAVAQAIAAALGELASYDRNEIARECEQRYAARHIVGEYERVLSAVVQGGYA